MQVNQYLHELVNHNYSYHVGTQNDILESGYADSTDRQIHISIILLLAHVYEVRHHSHLHMYNVHVYI